MIRKFAPITLVAIVMIAGIGSIAYGIVGLSSSASTGNFKIGVAQANITPPAFNTASDSAFVPACGKTVAQVEAKWPGKRLFAFEEPYIDTKGVGHYMPGDPYCQAGQTSGQSWYQGIYLSGSAQNRYAQSVEKHNLIKSVVAVYDYHGSVEAQVIVDSIGIFNSTMDAIRSQARQLVKEKGLAPINHILISSTHDESTPDPIGLWGPTQTASGIDTFYLKYLESQTAAAVAAADAHLGPAKLKLSYTYLPSNVQDCFSSYPFIADNMIPVAQAVNTANNHVILTLVNTNTHVETLAFSKSQTALHMISGDWVGWLRNDLNKKWPGSTTMVLSGLVGSVETPTVWTPLNAQVGGVPTSYLHNQHHRNPDGCSTVFPNPPTGTAVTDPFNFELVYAESLAKTVEAGVENDTTYNTVNQLYAQKKSLCVQVENHYFVVGFELHVIRNRPVYQDPTCSVPSSTTPNAPVRHLPAGQTYEPNDNNWVATSVAVLDVGSAQFAYLPGEVFPVTAIRGNIDEPQMPFPTNCIKPTTLYYYCGTPLPMTPWISAQMTQPYRFFAGLGEDMLGYMMPPGDFVGKVSSVSLIGNEVNQQPWLTYYKLVNATGKDRFGFDHADDPESVGPYAGLSVTNALSSLLKQDGSGLLVLPGLYIGKRGHLWNTPFVGPNFNGAVGVDVIQPNGKHVVYKIGSTAKGWATFDGTPDPGTPLPKLAYSTSTAGIILPSGKVILIDVYKGAQLMALGSIG